MCKHFQQAGNKWRHLKMKDKYELYTCTNNGSVWYHVILKWSWRKGMGLIWLRIRILEGSCEHSNEPLGSIQCGKIPDQWKNYSSSLSKRNPLHGISYLVSWLVGLLVGLFIKLSHFGILSLAKNCQINSAGWANVLVCCSCCHSMHCHFQSHLWYTVS